MENLFMFILYMFMMYLNVRGEKLVWGIMSVIIPLFSWMQGWWPVELSVFLMVVGVITLGVKLRGGA